LISSPTEAIFYPPSIADSVARDRFEKEYEIE